ncbi:MAG: ABC transporter substrate binding protein [Prochlorotrichaceae cyanobacterium]
MPNFLFSLTSRPYDLRLALSWILLLLCLWFRLLPLPATATPTKKAVLILFPYHNDLPGNEIARQAFREEFSRAKEVDLDVYYEYLDLARFPDPFHQEKIFDLLAFKYRNKQIDLIFIHASVMLNLWLEKRDTILPDTPVVFYNTSITAIEGLQFPPNVTGVAGNVDFTQSIQWILRVRPSVNQIVLVYGNGRAERAWIQPLDILRKGTGNQTQFADLSALSLDEIKQRIAALTPNSIVLYELMFEDAAGVKYDPIDVLRELTAVSPVPVISGYDQFVGTGTIGGYMYSTEQQTRDAVQIGFRILRGESVSNIPVQKDKSNRFIFDHLALQRYDISLSTLPSNSIIRNRQYSIWEEYQTEAIAAISTIVVLLFLAFFLIELSRKLNHARLELTHLNINLDNKVQERTAELQEANDHLKRLSNLDGLTNLYNRRYFDDSLKNEWKRHDRSQLPLSIIMCDIDFFKQYNDTYGHLVGDDCLRKVSKAIQDNVKRPSDIASRYGGEEFIIILTETDIGGAVKVALEIKNSVEYLGIEHLASKVKPIVSLSFGVATMTPDSTQEPEMLISLADNALYQSKEQGRDQIQFINYVGPDPENC